MRCLAPTWSWPTSEPNAMIAPNWPIGRDAK
jgi:hypothetical protein